MLIRSNVSCVDFSCMSHFCATFVVTMYTYMYMYVNYVLHIIMYNQSYIYMYVHSLNCCCLSYMSS